MSIVRFNRQKSVRILRTNLHDLYTQKTATDYAPIYANERRNCVVTLLTEIDTNRPFDYLCQFTFMSFRVLSTTQLKRGTGNLYTLQLIPKSQYDL